MIFAPPPAPLQGPGDLGRAITSLKVTVPKVKSTTHTITRCDATKHDAVGLYTSLSAYAFSGRAPTICEAPHMATLASGVVGFVDASCNCHSITLSEEWGATYSVVVPVVGGERLTLLVDGAPCYPLPVPPSAAVCRITLTREGGATRGLVECYALRSADVTPMLHSKSGSSNSLFADEATEDAPTIRRVPSKDQMGG